MNSWEAPCIAWMLAELIVSGLMLLLYLTLRAFRFSSADRYFFLCCAYATILWMPFVKFPEIARTPLRIVQVNSVIPTRTIETSLSVLKEPGSGFAPKPEITRYLLVIYAVWLALKLFQIIRSLQVLSRLSQDSVLLRKIGRVEIRLTKETINPMTYGFFKPVVIMSCDTYSAANEKEREMIIAHELQHIKRHDFACNLLRLSVQSLLVFSPFIAILGRFFREDVELACDERILESGKFHVKEYGNLLLRLATQSRVAKASPQMVLLMAHSPLIQRINSMTSASRPRRFALALIILCAFMTFSLLSIRILPSSEALAASLQPRTSIGGEVEYVVDLRMKNKKRKGDIIRGKVLFQDNVSTEISFPGMTIYLTPHQRESQWEVAYKAVPPAAQGVEESLGHTYFEGLGQLFTEFTLEAQDDNDVALILIDFIASSPTVNGLFRNGEKVSYDFPYPTSSADVQGALMVMAGKTPVIGWCGDCYKMAFGSSSDRPIDRQDAIRKIKGDLEIAGVDLVERWVPLSFYAKQSYKTHEFDQKDVQGETLRTLNIISRRQRVELMPETLGH